MNSNEPVDSSEYVLSAELVGHDRDVRGVLGLASGRVVTTSRDNCVRIWANEQGQEGWSTLLTLSGHTHFVGPVIEGPGGTIVTGGYDKMVIVWNAATGESEQMLLGHEEAVVALGVTSGGDIISGSWDQTIRVWRNGEAVQVLRGHEQAVWGVAGAPNGDIWSTSADKTVKIWRNGHCIKTLTQSEDCVRGLHVVPGTGVLVASNDQIVRLYSFDGELLRQLHGHESYVYAVTSIPPQHEVLVSGGEDCAVRIWQGSECVQTLQLPSNVWDVDTLPNGDLLVACADFIARVYTRDPQRAGSDEVRQAFDKRMVDAQEKMKEAQQKHDLQQYPGYEALQVDGTHDGQTIAVRKPDDSGAQAYQWQGGKWNLIGDVVGPAGGGGGGGGGNENVLGMDYEFPVDLNGQKYRIGMNKGDNVYETASQFIADNNLSAEFLDQIVDFLHVNVGSSGGGAAKPRAPPQELSYNPSPWADNAPPPAQKPQCFPKKSFVLFDAVGNLAGLTKKAVQFGASEPVLKSVCDKLAKRGSVIAPEELAEVHRMLTFSEDKVFPALDVLRLLALNESAGGNASFNEFERVIAALSIAKGPAPMLALKYVANTVRFPASKALLQANLGAILDACSDLSQRTDGKLLNALVICLGNVAVMLAAEGGGDASAELKTQALAVCSELLDSKSFAQPSDLTGLIQVVGTLAWKDEATRNLVVDLDIASKLDGLAKQGGNVAECAKQVATYARAMTQ